MSSDHQKSAITNHQPTKGVLLMKRLIHSCLFALLAIVVSAPRASAATTLDVNITFTIADIVAVQWNDATTAAKTWALGTVSLNNTYETFTPTAGTTWAAGPLSIMNVSSQTNTTVDIDLNIASTTTSWTDSGAANGADSYVVKAKIGASSAADLNTTGLFVRSGVNGPLVDFVNNLANGGNSGKIDFQIQLPSTITSGAGSPQSIVLRFTASVAN